MRELESRLLQQALSPEAACFPIEQLAAWSDHSRTVGAHLRGCRRCQTELSLLRRFEAAAAQPAEIKDVQWIGHRLERARMQPRRERLEWLRSWGKGLQLLAVAAGLLVVIAAGFEFRHAGQPALSSAAPAGMEALRSAPLTLISPLGNVTRAPQELRWNALPGAAAYEVRILAIDRSELWKARVSQPHTPLRHDAQRLLLPGRAVLWQVAAIDAAGRTLAESSATRIRLSLPGEPN